jgi:hypothetical protein
VHWNLARPFPPGTVLVCRVDVSDDGAGIRQASSITELMRGAHPSVGECVMRVYDNLRQLAWRGVQVGWHTTSPHSSMCPLPSSRRSHTSGSAATLDGHAARTPLTGLRSGL